MAISQKIRSEVFQKYDGHCAYCGCELSKGWHIDHKEPILRLKVFDHVLRRWVNSSDCEHPERDCFENYMPACQSCNINKHQYSLEDFRNNISNYMNHLNNLNTQYKMAKKYGLVEENIKPVVFHFEKIQNNNNVTCKH